MVMTVTANKVRENPDEIFAAITDVDPTVIVEDHGTQIAVVMSPERYKRLLDQEAAADWAVIHEMQNRNAHLDPDEVLRDVTEVVEEVRQELYEERLRAAQSIH